MGLACKPDISYTREFSVIRIVEELMERDAEIEVYDLNIIFIITNSGEFYYEENIEGILKPAECIILVNVHTLFKVNLEIYLKIIHNRVKE